MIDAKRYPSSREKGLVSIVEKDGELYLYFKRFDVRDGSEADPEIQKIDMNETMERKKILEKELYGINEVISDLDKRIKE